jgi:hypothetical protein|tara:strand:- start:451 stop:717 length:267 start_codon:yes stop_codon:yes gene_type:complete
MDKTMAAILKAMNEQTETAIVRRAAIAGGGKLIQLNVGVIDVAEIGDGAGEVPAGIEPSQKRIKSTNETEAGRAERERHHTPSDSWTS